MERGDVVAYDVTGHKGMHTWLSLNGRIGIVVCGPYPTKQEEYTERWGVAWLFPLVEERKPEPGPLCNYPVEFLRKIGHIDLDAN